MKRLLRTVLSIGGLLGSCAAAIQISQLATGQAAPDLWNYGVTAATAISGLGLTAAGLWPGAATASSTPADDQALVGALDSLFAHFADDLPAQEAVRVVARALIERRYRKQIEG
jgi:hypothetical protein